LSQNIDTRKQSVALLRVEILAVTDKLSVCIHSSL